MALGSTYHRTVGVIAECGVGQRKTANTTPLDNGHCNGSRPSSTPVPPDLWPNSISIPSDLIELGDGLPIWLVPAYPLVPIQEPSHVRDRASTRLPATLRAARTPVGRVDRLRFRTPLTRPGCRAGKPPDIGVRHTASDDHSLTAYRPGPLTRRPTRRESQRTRPSRLRDCARAEHPHADRSRPHRLGGAAGRFSTHADPAISRPEKPRGERPSIRLEHRLPGELLKIRPPLREARLPEPGIGGSGAHTRRAGAPWTAGSAFSRHPSRADDDAGAQRPRRRGTGGGTGLPLPARRRAGR